ncbi:TPA: hypothetical protein ACX6O4_001380 [Photobacterium damselae]
MTQSSSNQPIIINWFKSTFGLRDLYNLCEFKYFQAYLSPNKAYYFVSIVNNFRGIDKKLLENKIYEHNIIRIPVTDCRIIDKEEWERVTKITIL